MRYLVYIILLLAGGLAPASAANVSDELRASVAASLPDLNAYVRVVTGYKVTRLPKVVFRTPAELNRIYYGENYKRQDENCDKTICIKAVFLDGVIMLGTDFVPGRDDYILVHELTHYQQFEAGAIPECAAASEPEAYRVQDKFVADTGRGQKSNPLLVMMLAAVCDRHVPR